MLLGSLPDSFIAHAVLKGCDQPLSPWLQGLLGLELSLRKERKLGSLKSHLIIQGVPSDPGRPSKIIVNARATTNRATILEMSWEAGAAPSAQAPVAGLSRLFTWPVRSQAVLRAYCVLTVDQKKNTQPKSCKFQFLFRGLTEEYSPGNSLSVVLRRLL